MRESNENQPGKKKRFHLSTWLQNTHTHTHTHMYLHF